EPPARRRPGGRAGMSIQSTGGVGSTGTTPTPFVNPGGTLGKDDLLKLLAVQLQNQDPSDPPDNQQFTAPMAQLPALEQTTNMAQGFTQMAFSEQVNQSVSLIGHTIGYTKADGTAATGKAESVSVVDGNIAIKVGSDSVAPGAVTFVGGTS